MVGVGAESGDVVLETTFATGLGSAEHEGGGAMEGCRGRRLVGMETMGLVMVVVNLKR